MRQRAAFTAGEGDAYHLRNRLADPAARAARAARDPLLGALAERGVRARRALEIGAGCGWRLAALLADGRAEHAVGLEPSAAALADARARHPRIGAVRGTAERLPFADQSFDLVMVGFCLYLCDRADLFRVAWEVDRVLADGGVLAIYDFHADTPYRNPYAHRPGLYSYKMDYAAMFSWNPAYRLAARRTGAHGGGAVPAGPDDLVAVSILERRPEQAYADGPGTAGAPAVAGTAGTAGVAGTAGATQAAPS